MIMLVLCSGLLTATYLTALADHRLSVVENRLFMAQSCAESGAEYATVLLRRMAANFYIAPPDGSININGVQVNWSIRGATDEDGNDIELVNSTDDDLQVISKLYIVTSTATYEGATAVVEQYTSLDAMPIFQFFAFYDQDLEILPGPSMKSRGRVHTNNDLYLGSGNSLYFQKGYVRAAGDIWRKRKDGSALAGGKVLLDTGGDEFPVEYDSDFEGWYDGEYMDFAELALKKWDGFLMSGAHGVNNIEPPAIETIMPFSPNPYNTGDYTYNSGTGAYDYTPGSGTHDQGYYYKEARLRIIDNTMYLDGVDVTAQLPAGLMTSKTFYDGRENKNVTTTDIDVDMMSKAKVNVNGANVNLWPANGLIYCFRSDSSSSQPNGFRVTNAKTLPDKVTWVTPQPFYIWGDYNNANKKGSAVICDSINLLSKKWNDTKVAGSLPKADPAGTHYDLAMITGGYQTQTGKYNGGLENLPRFHENWSGMKAHMLTSFVNIWDSRVGKGAWVYGGDNYTAPTRDWYFDEDFLDPDKLPPYTPNVYTLRTVAWWRREFTKYK
jgi:hypothetical protein